MAVMHDDAGGAARAGELVCRALGVRAAGVHRSGLVVIGGADDPHASATGHNMHAPLVFRMRPWCSHGSKVPRPCPHVVVHGPQLVSVVHRTGGPVDQRDPTPPIALMSRPSAPARSPATAAAPAADVNRESTVAVCAVNRMAHTRRRIRLDAHPTQGGP